jgi:predicted nucleotidyltransferase
MGFDWTTYQGKNPWLRERTIYVTLHGSRAYGTNLPTSDTDYRGVCIAPKSVYLGFVEEFEQEVQEPPLPDLTIFEIRKFLKLATECNPNVIELLFTDPSDHLVTTPAWEQIVAVRDSFLTKRARFRFSKYALSQLKRINLHYRWLKNPPAGPPTREEFGLPEHTVIPADQLAAARSQIQKQLDTAAWHELDDLDDGQRQAIKSEFTEKIAEIMLWSDADMENKPWRSAAAGLGYSTNFIEYLDQERRYNTRQKDWESFQKWKRERNVDRALLEAKYGYDTKHALHLVRLLRMCREILAEGVVRVRRPDAEELLAIRNGAWTYEQLVEWAVAEDKALGDLMLVSKLPNVPDRALIDRLCQQIVAASF